MLFVIWRLGGKRSNLSKDSFRENRLVSESNYLPSEHLISNLSFFRSNIQITRPLSFISEDISGDILTLYFSENLPFTSSRSLIDSASFFRYSICFFGSVSVGTFLSALTIFSSAWYRASAISSGV